MAGAGAGSSLGVRPMPTFYECQRCTACCRWPGQVRLSEPEIAQLASFLGLTELAFIERFTRLRVDRRGLALTEGADGACVFLEGADCRVQPVKPKQCRDFPNGWNFPGFQRICRAVSREVEAEEYARLVGEVVSRSGATRQDSG